MNNVALLCCLDASVVGYNATDSCRLLVSADYVAEWQQVVCFGAARAPTSQGPANPSTHITHVATQV